MGLRFNRRKLKIFTLTSLMFYTNTAFGTVNEIKVGHRDKQFHKSNNGYDKMALNFASQLEN